MNTLKELISLHTGSKVPFQREDGESWMHGTIIEHDIEHHNGMS